MRRTLTIVLGFVTAALMAAPGTADWLVMRNGERIATAGPWTVREGLVVFRMVGGSLASLRVVEIDLSASRAATEQAVSPTLAVAAAPRVPAAAPRPPAAPVRPAPPASRPILVITDADVSHVEDEEEEQPEETSPSDARSLRVTAWKERVPDQGADGIHIVGRLANTSRDMVLRTSLAVRLLDAQGEEIAAASAQLSATSLAPTTSANFLVDFPGVYAYSDIEFEPGGFTVAFQAVSIPSSSSAGSP